MSLWSWALGSVCTIVSECYELVQLSKPPSTKDGQEEWDIKRMKAQAEINTRMITLVHSLFQVNTHPVPTMLPCHKPLKVSASFAEIVAA